VRLEAAEKRVQETEAAAESARQSAKRSESARLHGRVLLQQSMNKATRLEAEIEKLRAQDIERQDEIFAVRRRLNWTEANANQLTSRVAVLETEVTRAIKELSRETAGREVANNRLSALRTEVLSIFDVVLGAGSSTADPLERLRQLPERLRVQQREITSTGAFFGGRQALGVMHSNIPRSILPSSVVGLPEASRPSSGGRRSKAWLTRLDRSLGQFGPVPSSTTSKSSIGPPLREKPLHRPKERCSSPRKSRK
jgi:hypothetical protein